MEQISLFETYNESGREIKSINVVGVKMVRERGIRFEVDGLPGANYAGKCTIKVEKTLSF